MEAKHFKVPGYKVKTDMSRYQKIARSCDMSLLDIKDFYFIC